MDEQMQFTLFMYFLTLFLSFSFYNCLFRYQISGIEFRTGQCGLEYYNGFHGVKACMQDT